MRFVGQRRPRVPKPCQDGNNKHSGWEKAPSYSETFNRALSLKSLFFSANFPLRGASIDDSHDYNNLESWRDFLLKSLVEEDIVESTLEGKYARYLYWTEGKLQMDCRTASPHINDKTLKNTGPFWELVTHGTLPSTSCWETSWRGEDTENLETVGGKLEMGPFANS